MHLPGCTQAILSTSRSLKRAFFCESAFLPPIGAVGSFKLRNFWGSKTFFLVDISFQHWFPVVLSHKCLALVFILWRSMQYRQRNRRNTYREVKFFSKFTSPPAPSRYRKVMWFLHPVSEVQQMLLKWNFINGKNVIRGSVMQRCMTLDLIGFELFPFI